MRRAVSQAQIPAVQVPIALAAGAGLAAVTAATASLAASQQTATSSTLGLASAAQVENSAFGQQAVILNSVTAATLQKAGADATAARAAGAHAATTSGLTKGVIASTAGFTGLRGSVLSAGTAFLAGAIAVQTFARSISLAAGFEQELNVFRVTAGATADEMERVSEVSRELGRDISLPGVSATDAAQALSLLARAGLDVDDALEAARGTLQLATAAQIDNAQATELVANALNAFRLDGAEATRVADLLAGAANESQGSILDMGIALRQAAAAAAVVGISVEDTVTLLTQLAQAGLSSSDAGTSLRTALIRLVADMPKVEAQVEALGLRLRDAAGNVRPQVFGELQKALARLTPTARQAAIAALGGADAFRTFGLLARSGTEGFQQTQEAITEAGLAAELAGARTSGLSGDLEVAKNEAAELGLTIGQVAAGPFGAFVRAVGGATGAVNDFIAEAEQTGVFERFGQSIGDFTSQFAQLNVDFRRMAVGISATSKELSAFDVITDGATESVEALAAALREAGAATAAGQGRPGDTGLNVEQVLNRVQGFDAQEVRARISGDNNELLSVLAAEQEFLQAQLDRQFVKNRPALRRQLERALLGVTNDIAAIQRQGAADTKAVAQDAARAQQEADQALLATLANRRDDVERAGEQAEIEGNLNTAIQFENRLQALIKKQIQKVRDQIADEKARAAAVRQLRLALIASRQEEDALRQERAEEAAARKAEAINLDIDFAETIGNVDREIAARQRLIALLRKQQAAVKKGSNEWKRLRNAIAEQQQAIKEARGQAQEGQDDGRSAQQFFFEQLQAQQGFAANLLGNLITGPTEGLVGVPSPAVPDVGARIGAEVGAATGRAQIGPTAGQTNTEIDILLRILQEMRRLNGSYDAPEAINQKKSGSGSMDIAVM